MKNVYDHKMSNLKCEITKEKEPSDSSSNEREALEFINNLKIESVIPVAGVAFIIVFFIAGFIALSLLFFVIFKIVYDDRKNKQEITLKEEK